MARLALLALILLTGCTPEPVVRTVEVRTPYPVVRHPPDELAEPYHPDSLPEFVPPSHDEAKAALTDEGVKDLKRLILDLKTRDEAWREWAE